MRCVTFFMKIKQVITSFGNGYSQVLLQNNVVSGLFFFFATGIASFNMGHPEILYFSAISAALSPFFSWCLRYPDEEINEGIWGYNAVLYGIACGMVVPVSVSGIAVLIVGSLGIVLFTPLLSSVLIGLPVLTAPFIIATWLLHSGIMPHDMSVPSGEGAGSVLMKNYPVAFSGSFMEIFMFPDAVGGILVMLGLLAGSRKLLMITVVASFLSVVVSFCIPELSPDKISAGLYGYNAILTAVAVYAFAGDNQFNNIFLGCGAIILAFIIPVLIGPRIPVPLLTSPFVISTWLYILAQRRCMSSHI